MFVFILSILLSLHLFLSKSTVGVYTTKIITAKTRYLTARCFPASNKRVLFSPAKPPIAAMLLACSVEDEKRFIITCPMTDTNRALKN